MFFFIFKKLTTRLDRRGPRTQMAYEDTEITIWVARRGLLESLPAIYRRLGRIQNS